ncbi:helix-turn-helix domain-containing protein [Macrococcus psychrotolerans]|uniref:Sigma-70 family RNA polymerase sigma factor n=1 Tax=Macrococcus psychrotolerans TaxID=3039389 RepID=A0AAT9P7T0_9STAP|nr:MULTISPECIES: hypothetical protein [Macrococcus]QYA33843.1 hypothetical protein KYI10_05265 [Macrococcus sp. 19Msa1099]QYA38663.1 hypothetical protein KYI07_05255 [Macrococcus caseolyticus]QYA77370.1 hypothetical protein KYI12_05255 [Macrococcus caseolyticus]
MLSIFIMDVSNSTQLNNTDDISKALEGMTESIEQWTQSLNFSYINYRMGDELFFVSDCTHATLLISYYIKLLWPYKSQPVKFGIAAGNEEVPKRHIEHWNSKLTKAARNNLERIKKSDISDFYVTIEATDMSLYNDVLFPYLTEIVQNHSLLQQAIFQQSLYIDTQKEIAQLNNKSVSTISEHLNKAHYKQLGLIKKHLTFSDAQCTIEPSIIQSLQGGLTWL